MPEVEIHPEPLDIFGVVMEGVALRELDLLSEEARSSCFWSNSAAGAWRCCRGRWPRSDSSAESL